MNQQLLFDAPPQHCLTRFNGSDYQHDRDAPRLTGQLQRIVALMRDGQWRTLSEIAAATGAPEASVSAQLRHARKPRFGSHVVEKVHEGNGLFRYRLTLRSQP